MLIARDRYIPRKIETLLKQRLYGGKALLLMGARQTGKTTLLRYLFGGGAEVLWLNADDPEVRLLLEEVSVVRWRQIIGRHRVLVLDEAQRIANIGLKLKLITDQIPEVQIVATGSSSFELANEVNEPLTGRKWEYRLFPIAFSEMVDYHGWLEEKKMLPNRLIFGYYPEVVQSPGQERELLVQLADSFLYKDLLIWEQIKKPEKLIKLLQSLAYQVGQEVSFHELGQIIDLDNQTVERYIYLLEKAYVIFRLQPLSRNLRKELKTKRKVYFYDNGIRNAIIAQFQPWELRSDKSALWENFLISERRKFLEYNEIWGNRFFWRSQDQQEIDYVEERDGAFHLWEFKWNVKSRARFPKTFLQAYPVAGSELITPDNFETFITP